MSWPKPLQGKKVRIFSFVFCEILIHSIINKLEEQNQNLTKQVIYLKTKTQITNNNSFKIRRVCKINWKHTTKYILLHCYAHNYKNFLNDIEKQNRDNYVPTKIMLKLICLINHHLLVFGRTHDRFKASANQVLSIEFISKGEICFQKVGMNDALRNFTIGRNPKILLKF